VPRVDSPARRSRTVLRLPAAVRLRSNDLMLQIALTRSQERRRPLIAVSAFQRSKYYFAPPSHFLMKESFAAP
jgi:hypothetical protein